MLALRNKLFLLIIGLALLVPATSFSGPLQDLVAKKAKSNLYVREKTGKNDGPEIETWLRYVGLGKGDPYCAAFAVYMYSTAAIELGYSDKFPLPKTGRSASLLNYAKKNPVKYTVITPNQVILGAVKLQQADVSIHQRGPEKNGDFTGHTGISDTQVGTSKFTAEECNTSASYAGDQGEGEGCYEKLRPLKSAGFPVKGFIRVKGYAKPVVFVHPKDDNCGGCHK